MSNDRPECPKSVAPKPRLAAELKRVAESAQNVIAELGKTNLEQTKFPKQKVIDIAQTVIALPGGSEDDALPALEYAETALSDIRYSFVEIAEGDLLPDVPRGGRVDQSLLRLISDISTAKRFYSQRKLDAAAKSESPDLAVATLGAERHETAERADIISRSGFDVAGQLDTSAADLAERNDPDRVDPLKWGRGRRPVIMVSWDDAQAYWQWLNEMTDLQGDAGYRLPSEVEWEYACRAGTDTRRWWGDEWDRKKANGDNFDSGRTNPVDQHPANPWGLHDMIGNVWEWCADRYAENISDLPDDGTPFDGRKGELRVLRGGSWNDHPRTLRSAVRYWGNPDYRVNDIGFRVARTILPS